MSHATARGILEDMNLFGVLTVIFAVVGIPLFVALAVLPAVWDGIEDRVNARAKRRSNQLAVPSQMNSGQPAVTGTAVTRW